MSPRIAADFSKISTDFEPLPAGDYRVVIDDIEENKKNDKDQLVFQLVVSEGEYEGRKLNDFCILQQNDGKINNVSLGRIKAYTEAVLGKEAASGGEIDTDALKKGSCIVVVKHRSYEKKDGGGQGTSVDVVKVLPVN